MTTRRPTPPKSLIFHLSINRDFGKTCCFLSLTFLPTSLVRNKEKIWGFPFSLVNLVQTLKMSNFSFAEWSNLLDQWGESSNSSSSNADHKPGKTIPTTTSVEKLIKEIENPLTREHALFAISRVYIKNAKKLFFFCNMFGW